LELLSCSLRKIGFTTTAYYIQNQLVPMWMYTIIRSLLYNNNMFMINIRIHYLSIVFGMEE